MIVLGAAFVLVPACIWPSVPLIVEPQRVGTAFGVMTAIQNIGLAAFPSANGALHDATGNFTASQIMFAGLGFCGLIFSLLLLRADQPRRRPSGTRQMSAFNRSIIGLSARRRRITVTVIRRS